jgi:Deoxyribonuclease NucA/NucB
MPILGVPALAGAAAGGGTVVVGGAAATGATVSTGTLLTGAALVGTGLLLSGDTPVNSTAVAAPALSPNDLADRLKKAKDLAKALAAAAAASCATGNCCQRTVVVSRSRSPLSAQHIDEAQAMGFPSTLTLDRPGAPARRAASLRGIPTRPGLDRDEYPPAVFAENGGAASVRYVPLSDNRSAGRQILTGITGAPDGCRITLVTGP